VTRRSTGLDYCSDREPSAHNTKIVSGFPLNFEEPLYDRGAPGQLGRDLPGQQHLRRQDRLGHTQHGSIALRTALTEAAHAASRTKGTHLAAARHAQIRAGRGLPKAIGATRHDILIAYWHVVHDDVDYRDLGPD
jgi:hypothetical protein